MALLLPARAGRKRQFYRTTHIRPLSRVLVWYRRRYRDNCERQQDHLDRRGNPVSCRQPLRHTDIHNACLLHPHPQYLPDRNRRHLRLPSHSHSRRKHSSHNQPLLRLFVKPEPGLSHIPAENGNRLLLKPQSDGSPDAVLQQKLDDARSTGNTQDVLIGRPRTIRHSFSPSEPHIARRVDSLIQLAPHTSNRVRAELHGILVAQLDLLVERSQRSVQFKTCNDRQQRRLGGTLTLIHNLRDVVSQPSSRKPRPYASPCPRNFSHSVCWSTSSIQWSVR